MSKVRSRGVPGVLSLALVVAAASLPALAGSIEEDWPAGQANTCRSADDGYMDFEIGVDDFVIESSILGAEFTTTGGLNWKYGDIRTGNYNVRPYGTGVYETIGNFFAWLGTTGDVGRVTFVGGNATYVSVLVSTNSGLYLEAYDADGNLVDSSGFAPPNTETQTLTRMTVQAPNIAYVEIHDTGNFWLMDDLCTDAPSPCQRVEGYGSGNPSERIDLVFVPSDDYEGDLTTFQADVLTHIGRLLTHPPLDTAGDKFNFYFTNSEGTAAGFDAGSCATLPADLLEQCPFLDAAAVLHVGSFTDCTSFDGGVGVFGGEGHDSTLRSFIHEGGHAMFRLSDEYDDVGRGCVTPYDLNIDNNVWDTDADCETTVTDNGGDPDQCYQFTTCQDGWFKLGDPALATDDDRYADTNFRFIMLDGTEFSKGWGDASTWRMNTVLGGLGARAELPNPEPSGEQSLFLELQVEDSGISLLDTGFRGSAAPNYAGEALVFEVRMYSADGSLLGTFPFDDPRVLIGEQGGNEPPPVPSRTATVVLPYFFNIDHAHVLRSATGEVLLEVDLSMYTSSAVGPVADADGPYEGVVSVPMQLDGSGSHQPDGTLVRYEWDMNGDGTVDVDTNSPLAEYVPTAKYDGVAYLRVSNPDGLTDVSSTTITVVARADVAVVSTEVLDPPAAVLIGQAVDITVRSVVTNHGPTTPIDAKLKRSATAESGTSVSPEDTLVSVSQLALEELRQVDIVYSISCQAPGKHTFSFTDELSLADPEDEDPDLSNNGGETSLLVDCVVPVALNNKPGGFPNSFEANEQSAPTAVLTTAAGEYGLPLAFDATRIQPTTVRWGDRAAIWAGTGGSSEIHRRGHNENSYELDDRRRDGDHDMVLHFSVPSSGLTRDHAEACVKGTFRSTGGHLFTFFGCDSIRVVPPRLVDELEVEGMSGPSVLSWF